MVSLLDLPHEVILLILTELSTSSQVSQGVSQNLLFCRQTCTQLRDFATPLIFKTRHVLMEKTNIENLIRISECSHLAKHIQALQIHALDLLPSKNLKREAAEGDVISASHEDLSNYIARRFVGVLSRLEACKRITFDSANPAWNPFRLGQSAEPFLPLAAISQNAAAIIRILVRVFLEKGYGRSHLKVLEICSGHIIQKAICFMLAYLSDMPTPVTSLRRLHLVVKHDFEGKDKLKMFLGLFPELTNLNLGMDSGEPLQDSNGVLSDLHVPTLQKLTLTKVSCTTTDLENFIIRHQKSLQDITLICIKLPEDRSWGPILQKIAKNRKLIGFSMAECLQDKDLEPSDITELIDFIKKRKIGFET